jgi:hypothetical protein
VNSESGGRSLREVVATVSGEALKRLLYRCGARGKSIPTRKDDLVEALVGYLLSPGFVHEQLMSAPSAELLALAEAAHGDGTLHPDLFRLKYGVEIVAPDLSDLGYRPIAEAGGLSLIALFLYEWQLPADVRELLRHSLKRPPAFEVEVLTELPEQATVVDSEDDNQQTGLALRRIDSATAALPDLLSTLALINDGKLSITPKTGQPTAAALRQLAKIFVLPDVMLPGSLAVNDDGVREFAFVRMSCAAGLATPDGSRLALTDSGRRAFSEPDPSILKAMWNAWLSDDSFDELSRAKGIRGQRSRGTYLTAPSTRKKAIAQALATCPAGGWVHIGHFLAHIRLDGHDFDMEHDSTIGGLYVGPATSDIWIRYDYSPEDYWSLFQAAYARIVLMEYAATLGVIDFATVAPEEAPLGFDDDAYGDEFYLSRYDGLAYLRIGPLGRYILGQTDSYDGPPLVPGTRGLVVLPSLDIVVADRSHVLPWERAAIERIARKTSDDVYKLSKESLIDVAEQGGNLTEAESFLRERSREELPQTVTVLFADARRAAAAVSGIGSALLVRCANETIAQQLASHTATRRFCLLAADAHVAVPAESIAEFRRGVKRLGYVLLGERSIQPSGAKRRN